MTFDPDRIFHETSQAGEKWVDAQAAYDVLDETTKSVLASMTTDFMDTGMTKGEAEIRAQASAKWKEFLASKVAAKRAAQLAKVRYDAIKALSENRRSQESTRRAEMGMR